MFGTGRMDGGDESRVSESSSDDIIVRKSDGCSLSLDVSFLLYFSSRVPSFVLSIDIFI